MKFLKLITLSAAMLLVTAAPAFAGSVRYQVPASTAYTVDGNGTGIVKVTYNACVVAGASQTIQFTSTVRGSNDSTATWELIGNTELGETASFSPPTVSVRKNVDVVDRVTLGFVPALADRGSDFRIQLNGEAGLGNGPGIVVSVNCVVPASGTTTTGALPSVASARRQGTARCLRLSGVKLRAGERRSVRVLVTTAGNPVLNALVRARGAGVNKTVRTDERGYARLRLKPTRKGTVYFQTSVCAGADRKSVAAAFGSDGVAAPRSTG